MNLVPDPLHPAVVHFPIVLLLVGTLTAVLAVFWRKGYLPAFAAVLLAFAALGAWAALATGQSDAGLIEKLNPKLEALVDEHEEWAERVLIAALIAAVAAIGSAMLGRFARLSRGAAAVAAVAAMAASYAVYEAGHRGGELVFKHGAGINIVPAATVSPTTPPARKEDDHD